MLLALAAAFLGTRFPPPPPPFEPPGYTVLGSIDVATGESTIFRWRPAEDAEPKMYILENIFCGYVDHFGQWAQAFRGHSYARIRDLESGYVVSNISATIGTSLVSIFIDVERGLAWLSALDVDRCHAQCGVGVLAISSADLVHWESSPVAELGFRTCNTQVAAVDAPPPGMPPHRFVMILEPFHFWLNNNADGDLTHGWFAAPNASAPHTASGGPSIRFEGGMYYVITGGHNVMLARSADLRVWEATRTLIAPTPGDAEVARLAGFPGKEARRKGFYAAPAMEEHYDRWDYNSNDGDVCCSDGSTGAWLVWGASSQGGVCQAKHCSTNAVGHNASLTLRQMLEAVFDGAPTDVPTRAAPPAAAVGGARRVAWYTALAAESGPAQVADSAEAATGYLACCNQIVIDANASLSSAGVAALSQQVALGGGKPVGHTVRVDGGLEWNDTVAAAAAARGLVDLVAASGASGAMIDWEPPRDAWTAWGPAKTRRVAAAYAEWAAVLARELHARNLSLGLDLAGDDGGSPIDLFPVFAAYATEVDELFLMGTYHGADPAYAQTLVSRALRAGIAPSRLSVGLGSTSEAGTYNWTASSLPPFLSWLEAQGIGRLGVWRSDLDANASDCRTDPAFRTAVEAFLHASEP